ncbi:MAG: DUF3800 domain-containing protein [Gemmataceae bacterium]
MPTYIDESGDIGPCADPQRCFFRLAAVYLPTMDMVAQLRADLNQARQLLGLPAGYEFKFSQSANYPDRRRIFFDAAMRSDFRFAFVSIDKADWQRRELPVEWLQYAAVTELAATMRPLYAAEFQRRKRDNFRGPHREQIFVDDNGDPRFFNMLLEQFRGIKDAKGSEPFLFRARFVNSKTDVMIQLADMICGATGAMLDGKEMDYVQIQERRQN